ncbi:unnamed protein product [Eruca vesicaria subsp. sativa]|uniref:Uncharacterized protein n=1 Tax=Eruca vesicaria subsp. sativa TaxID=29727 RepID=A0ABC8JCH9_ERUVS|nr:unnamed protein product [Eruca vesicaria subsp. sativa]
MGCGKSKLDVVTGNTRTFRKPLEAESVNGKEHEKTKKQESCQCQKTVAVSADRPDTTLENNTKKPKEKETEVDCDEKSEEKEAVDDEHKVEEKETSVLPPVMAIVPENIGTEETSNDVNKSVLIVDEQNDEGDIETVVEEEKSNDDKISGDDDTEISPPETEELKPDVQTSATTESEVQDTLTSENVETMAIENIVTASKENNEVPVLKDEDKVDHVEENLAKEAESA